MVAAPQHYVYLYRDPETNAIRYVGKGTGGRVDKMVRTVYESTTPERAIPATESRDKEAVRTWFRTLKARRLAPAVEIIPCEDDAQAAAIEAGLISALWDTPILNKVRGHHRRFTPLGLPTDSRAIGERRFDRELTRQELRDRGGAIVVLISTTTFASDSRRGAIPILPRSETQQQRQRDAIHDRICKWWQIGPYIEDWVANPSNSPTVLLGVTGPPARRWVWGALKLDKAQWKHAERHAGGLYALPAVRAKTGVTDTNLDAFKYRGRRIAPGEFGGQLLSDGSRKFNGIRSQTFDVV